MPKFPPRFALHQLREIATAAGATDHATASLLAASMKEESNGNPLALGDYVGSRPTSIGILQVHEPDWPAIAAATRAAMDAPMVTDYGRAVAEVHVAKPILEDAMHQALAAAKALQDRHFRVELQDVLVLADAAWQGPGVGAWAATTNSGDPAEIRESTAPGRGRAIRAHLAELGVGVGPGPGKHGWVLPVGLALGAGLVLWAVMEGWE
jgi:hypothetical protein